MDLARYLTIFLSLSNRGSGQGSLSMAVNGPDDDLILGEFSEPPNDETTAVAGWIIAIVGLVYVDKSIVLGTEMKDASHLNKM